MYIVSNLIPSKTTFCLNFGTVLFECILNMVLKTAAVYAIYVSDAICALLCNVLLTRPTGVEIVMHNSLIACHIEPQLDKLK